MALEASCPRCTVPLEERGEAHHCREHGEVDPLWRPRRPDYQSLAEMLGRYREIPTYLPWPMSPGWSLADFGCVGDGVRPSATLTTTVGTSDLDGEVSVCVVLEDPGVGLGARCAVARHIDPGDQVGEGPASARIRAGGRSVPLWPVDTGADARDTDVLDRSVFAGECLGRWLWLVLRPAPAALLLHDEWLLADLGAFGPEAVEMPFGGTRPTW